MDEEIVRRTMPHSIDAEKSVIGTMLMDKDAISIASAILSEDDFYAKQYGVLFRAIVELDNEGRNTDDLVILKEKLIQMNVPPEISDLEYIKEILALPSYVRKTQDYCDIVKDKSVLRKLIRINEDIMNSCFDEKEPVKDILEDSEKKIFDIVQNRSTHDFTPISDIVFNALEHISIVSASKSNVTGVASGFYDLDFLTAGFQPSDLILLAARPSMGKTAFVLNIAHNICMHDKRNAVIFSLEMSKEQLINRLLAQESRIDSQRIRTGNLDSDEWKRLIDGASAIADSKLIIDDTPSISVSELRSKCRRYKHEHNIDIIFIDYLQLMSGGNSRAESKQQEIADISKSLKALARELNVPVIALSQLSRAVEKRDDHRPMLSDLRESGAIEQDADVVMFLYRDDYYHKENSEKPGISEVIIAKQRNGPTGTVELVWLKEYTKYVNSRKKFDNKYENAAVEG